MTLTLNKAILSLVTNKSLVQNIVETVIFTEISTLKIATQVFHMTLLLVMHHHTTFGYKRLSGSEDTIWTKPGHMDRQTQLLCACMRVQVCVCACMCVCIHVVCIEFGQCVFVKNM